MTPYLEPRISILAAGGFHARRSSAVRMQGPCAWDLSILAASGWLRNIAVAGSELLWTAKYMDLQRTQNKVP